MAEPVVVGIDVSKAKLDLAVLPSGEQFTVGHDRAGIASLMERLKALAPAPVVLEATGKLERRAVSELAGAGLTGVVVDPGRVRHYAKACGKWAKTDPIDARLIAEFARDLKPQSHPGGSAKKITSGFCSKSSPALMCRILTRASRLLRKAARAVTLALSRKAAGEGI